MNEKNTFTTSPEHSTAIPPQFNPNKSTILTFPFILLFITLFALLFFTIMYVDYLLFPATFSNLDAYSAIVSSSWTFVISTIVVFIFFRTMFLVSFKQKVNPIHEQISYRIVDELPAKTSSSNPTATVISTQTEILPLVDSPNPETSELVAKVTVETLMPIESISSTTVTMNGFATEVKEIPAEFSKCADWMDKTFQQQGFIQKQASEFLSLMVFSRLILIANHPSQQEFLQIINGFFASEGARIDASLSTAPLDQQPLLSSVFASAKSKPHLPHFIYLHHVDPKELPYMLGVFEQYSRFPLQSKTISLGGETFTIPSNLWFIITLKPGAFVFLIPENLRSHLGVYTIQGEMTQEETLPTNLRVKYDFNWDKASRIFSPTYESKKLSEDLWKKVDQWVALMHQVSGYELKNDVNLRLENYVLLGLNLNLDPLAILDQAFASSLLIHALAKAKPTAYQKETDLERFFEGAFGRKSFKYSLELIRHYLKESFH